MILNIICTDNENKNVSVVVRILRGDKSKRRN